MSKVIDLVGLLADAVDGVSHLLTNSKNHGMNSLVAGGRVAGNDIGGTRGVGSSGHADLGGGLPDDLGVVTEAHVVGGADGLAVVLGLLGDEGVDGVEVGGVAAGLHVQVLALVGDLGVGEGTDGGQVGGPLLGVGGEGLVPDEVGGADLGAGLVVGVEGRLLVGGEAAGGGGSGGGGSGSRAGGSRGGLLDDGGGGGGDGGGNHGSRGGGDRNGGGLDGTGDGGLALAPVSEAVPAPAVGLALGLPSSGVGGHGGDDDSRETHLDGCFGGFVKSPGFS